MDDNNNQMRQISFCRKCGNRLTDGSMRCSKCGTEAVLCDSPSTQELNETVSCDQASVDMGSAHNTDDATENSCQTDAAPAKKTRGKYLLFSSLGIVLLAAVVFLLSRFIPTGATAQSIDSINGCPEFFDIEFGMTVDQASKQIDTAHDAIMGDGYSQDSFIVLSPDSDYSLHGFPVETVYCGFDGLKMDTVIIAFSKDEASMEEIMSLYEKIYGQATMTDLWLGKSTMIEVIDGEELESKMREIIVRYTISPNSHFQTLSFNGSEIDPCGFLSDNYIFDKEASYFIDGLTENDYGLEEFSAEGFAGFSQYTLYPQFEYMGVPPGRTAIEFCVEAGAENINVVTYIFLLDSDNASDNIKYIEKTLSDAYGDYVSCCYTSTVYGGAVMEEIPFTTFCRRVGMGTQGAYNIQWESTEGKITLSLTVNPERKYYQGGVAFS